MLTNRQINNRIARIEELANEIKELQALQESIKDELKLYMGTNEHVETELYKLNYTNVETERLDTKALKSDLPDVYGKYTKTTKSRRFTYYDK